MFQKIMSLGEMILKGERSLGKKFNKGKIIREKFLREKFENEEEKEITPFNIQREDLVTFSSAQKSSGSFSRPCSKNKNHCFIENSGVTEKTVRMSPRARSKEPLSQNTSFYKKIFSKASSNNLKIRQRLFKKSKNGFKSGNLGLRNYYIHPGKENIRQISNILPNQNNSFSCSKTSSVSKRFKQNLLDSKNKRFGQKDKSFKFSKNLNKILDDGKKALKKRKNSSSQFLRCLKQMKTMKLIQAREKKAIKSNNQDTQKKGLTTVPALKSLKTAIADQRTRLSIRSNKVQMNTKFESMRKALQKKSICPLDKSDLKTRNHKFSENGSSFVDLMEGKHSFYNKKNQKEKELTIVQKRRANLNTNTRKKLSAFKSNKTPMSYKNSSLSLGAKKYGNSEPVTSKDNSRIESKRKKIGMKLRLALLDKKNSNCDFFGQKRHSLFTDRSAKAHINMSMSNAAETGRILNTGDMSNTECNSTKMNGSRVKDLRVNGSNSKDEFKGDGISQNLQKLNFKDRDNYGLKPVSSYFKNRSPFKKFESLIKDKTPPSNYLNRNLSSKKMDYSLVIPGSETWRSRKNSDVNDYSAIKRTQNMINRKFRSIESKFNKSGIKIKSFIG